MTSESQWAVPRKLWEHPDPTNTSMWRFMQNVNMKRNLRLETHQDLYDWSVTRRSAFWQEIWEQLSLIHEGSYTTVVDESARMDSIPQWFRGVRLNYAENILFTHEPGTPATQRSTRGKEDAKIAVTEVREGATEIRDVSWKELRMRVGLLSNALRAHGFKRGDRVAVVASNSADTLAVFMASTAVGGLFSSSSTDMGTKGVLDRLTQIKPRFVFVDDGAVYNGKTLDLRPKMREIVQGMKGVAEFEALVSLPRWQKPEDVSDVPFTVRLAEFLQAARGDHELRFERVEFRDPFLVVYSSGTTGMPKCIVHSTGGLLVSAMKEGRLNYDYGPDVVKLQYTTTGWIMYLSSVLGLLHSARVILYDGSPFQPDMSTFVRLVGDQKVTHLGISPRYMHEFQKNNLSPREIADLSSLRCVTSTGMVLSDPLFEWFYDKGFPPQAQLANISGGTDLAACFGLGNPLTPLYVGGCQGPGLGIKVEVYDSTIEGGKDVPGRAVEDGVPGELVATKAFPNMPTTFWGKGGFERYLGAYFSRFSNVWAHGDFIQVHPVTKQIIFLGRADGVLNPSGVRFGSAEIYSVIEANFPEVQDSICVGQRRQTDADESVILFLLMRPGEKFTERLVEAIKQRIAAERSKRHVPKYIFETPEIPTTVNLKKVELPVKQIVSGRIIKPSGTLLNPQSLEYYYQFAKIEDVLAKQSRVKSKL